MIKPTGTAPSFALASLAVAILALCAIGGLVAAGPALSGAGTLRGLNLSLLCAAAAILAEGVLACASISSRSRADKAAKAEAEASARKALDQRESVVREHKGAWEAGSGIRNEIDKTVSAVHRLEGLASGTTDGIEVLSQALLDTASANERISLAQGKVRAVLGSYSELIAAESADVGTMANAVRDIAESSRKKREMVGSLIGMAGAAESKLALIKASIDKIIHSEEKVNEMSALIIEVADRTNLLAMNASIEAAHSGSAGRGFAVIASHVRELSVEAARGSRTILESLKETKASIGETMGAADEAIEYFRNVSLEIRGIAAMLEELLAGMQGISTGASGLLDSVEKIDKLTIGTGEAVSSAESSIDHAKKSIGTVVEIASTIRSDSASMMSAFGEMLAHTEQVRALGLENMGHIEALKAELDR